MSDEPLYDRALAQEGNPIPAGQVVVIELVDSHGTVCESWALTRNERTAEVAKWAGDYIVSMAAEGMAGAVRWTNAQGPEESST